MTSEIEIEITSDEAKEIAETIIQKINECNNTNEGIKFAIENTLDGYIVSRNIDISVY